MGRAARWRGVAAGPRVGPPEALAFQVGPAVDLGIEERCLVAGSEGGGGVEALNVPHEGRQNGINS